MWEKIRVIFTIPELRQKILLTLMFLAIYRIGWHIPLPMVNTAAMRKSMESSERGGWADLVTQAATFAASDLSQATIFGLGIMPYISASIIFQLLASVWKPLEELQKEGESGRKKINEYTRYATVFLCMFQSYVYLRFVMGNPGWIHEGVLKQMNSSTMAWIGWQIAAVMTMTAGTVFLMWLGEQIDEFGIGNGISLLIMAGILARMPRAGWDLLTMVAPQLGSPGGGKLGLEHLLIMVSLFVAVVAGVVFITQGQRRIPTQSAKHVRGRRVFGGTRQYLPLRVNQAGVMPIIFASSLLMIPMLIFQNVGKGSSIMRKLADMFQRESSFTYNLLYVAMIYFFCYFWTAITFNPKDMADNLKNYGSFIPGYRPGRRTADYLERVMVRITYVGAGFLAVIAIMPTIVSGQIGVPPIMAAFYGGTSLLIAVSVAFDLVQKIDSHLVMRNYKGLLER
jgi:preprotein translocase subunit SecY